MRSPVSILSGVFCAVLLAGCGNREPKWHEYEEYYAEPPSRARSGMVPQATESKPAAPAGKLRWTAPEGWSEQPGASMRLVTFAMGSGTETGACTIIKLGGAAGGVEANIVRWMGQIGVEPPADAELAAFIERQPKVKSEGGLDGVLVDLTSLGDAAPGTVSMLAALFPLGDMTAFVKLTGPKSLLAGEKERFEKLCRSLRREDG